MLSFNQERKDELIANLEAHAKADAFRQGIYFESGKGCAVGCSLVDFGENPDDHSAYERLFGIPIALAKLEDTIFECLSVEESKNWPLDFARAVPVCTDLSAVGPKFLVRIISDFKQYADEKGEKVIDMAVNLLARQMAGEDIKVKEWLRVKSAVYTGNCVYAASSINAAINYASSTSFASSANDITAAFNYAATAAVNYAATAAAKQRAVKKQSLILLEILRAS